MERPPCTTFWVTGFGAFPGVPANPTEQLIALLQEQPAAADGPHRRQPYHIGGTAVLEVSAVAARKWTDWLFRERLAGGAPDAADAVGARSNGAPAAAAPAAAEDRGASREAGPLVVLHLGVDAQATHFKLESVAANEATFRVPDQRGWQPSRALIDDHPGCGLGTRLATDLDVAALAERLAAAGHDARPSDDAGRYVCNYTYYLSLLASQKGRTRRGAPLHALFFHVPPAALVPIEAQQLRALLALMRAIAEQLAAGEEAAGAAGEEAAGEAAGEEAAGEAAGEEAAGEAAEKAAAEPALATAAADQLAEQLAISSLSDRGPGTPAAAAVAATAATTAVV